MGERPPEAIDSELRQQVLERLGVAAPPSPDLPELRRLYRAWCEHVPFDNVRKMIALRAGPAAALPGGDARDFFTHWLAHGAGGTCWPTSNALHDLLHSLGFAARRVAASMRDLGPMNHGTVKVRLEGLDWLVDSSLLTMEPLPLGEEVFVRQDPVFAAEVEPAGDTHLVWADLPPNPEYLPCRLVEDPVDHPYYLERYEVSRTQSPFNQRLFARVNRPGEIVVLLGHTRYVKTAAGLASRELSADEVCAALRREIGLSQELIERWVASGGLADSMAAPGAPPPPSGQRPPSLRDR